MNAVIQQLLGCGWGRAVSTPDEPEPCQSRAVQIVVLHDGPAEHEVRLCARHRDYVVAITDPHRETVDE